MRVTTCSQRDLPLLPPFLLAHFLLFDGLEDDWRNLSESLGEARRVPQARVVVRTRDLGAWNISRLRGVHTLRRRCR